MSTIDDIRGYIRVHDRNGFFVVTTPTTPMYQMVDEVQAENAKLRELITDVHEALCADKAGIFHKLTLASMEDDMRELGIEVES